MRVHKRPARERIDYASYKRGRWPPVARVLRAEWDFVMEIAERSGVAHGERQDVALEVFLRYHLYRWSISSPLAIRAWLRSTALHVAADMKNRKTSRFEIPVDPEGLDPQDPAPSPEEALSAQEGHRALLGLVNALEPGRREVFKQYADEHRSMSLLSAELGIPQGTAYTRLRLAREALRAALGRRPLESIRPGTADLEGPSQGSREAGGEEPSAPKRSQARRSRRKKRARALVAGLWMRDVRLRGAARWLQGSLRTLLRRLGGAGLRWVLAVRGALLGVLLCVFSGLSGVSSAIPAGSSPLPAAALAQMGSLADSGAESALGESCSRAVSRSQAEFGAQDVSGVNIGSPERSVSGPVLAGALREFQGADSRSRSLESGSSDRPSNDLRAGGRRRSLRHSHQRLAAFARAHPPSPFPYVAPPWR